MCQPSIVNTALQFQTQNNITRNFCLFLDKFNLDENNLPGSKRNELTKICKENYDRYSSQEINHGPEAISYATIKNTIYLEKYLILVRNTKHRIALRLSYDNLVIRPRIERNYRKSVLCKDEVEDEKHLITKCPLYAQEYAIRFQACQNSTHFDSLSVDQKFILILTNDSKEVTTELAKFDKG